MNILAFESSCDENGCGGATDGAGAVRRHTVSGGYARPVRRRAVLRSPPASMCRPLPP